MSTIRPNVLLITTISAFLLLSGCISGGGGGGSSDKNAEDNPVTDLPSEGNDGDTEDSGDDGDSGDSGDDGDTGEIGDIEEPPTESQQITLNWQEPTTRTDGTCLNAELAGFRVNYQSDSGSGKKDLAKNDGALSCTQVDTDSACGDAMVYSCSYTLEDLEADTWNITVQAYDNDELFSVDSEPVKVEIN